MVYIHIDSGIGNDRTFKTALVHSFNKIASDFFASAFYWQTASGLK